jgi:DNA-binding protein HU-alpha
MPTTKGTATKAKAKSGTRAAGTAQPSDKAPSGAIASVRNRVPAPAIRPSIVAVPPISVVPNAAEPAADAVNILKKPDFIDRVVERSGEKKRHVKPILEAALAVLGEALSNGEELNLQPLGRVKVNRHRVDDDAELLILKLRRNARSLGLAEAGDDTSLDLPEDDEDD